MYQITRTVKGNKRVIKDKLTMQPKRFETAELAQKFADGMVALARCDWKMEGRALPRFTVEAA